MIERLTWRIVLRGDGPAVTHPDGDPFPERVVTVAPRFDDGGMPPEVGLLLPTNPGPKALIDYLAEVEDRPSAAKVVGLFLASPFLNVARESTRLTDLGVTWVTNLPSVAQQDQSFAQQLTDVGLDFDRELEVLAGFKAQGLRIAVVVADGPGAAAATAVDPEALIVLPRVADFAAGFPSLRQRGAAAQAVNEAASAAGWRGLRLGLGEAGEAEHESLWPDALDGLICRPIPA